MARKLSEAVTNVTEETEREQIDAILGAHGEMEKVAADLSRARGRYRGTLKAAKKLGMSADAITAAIAERKREPLERVQHFRKMARYLRLMGAPLGTQLTIFDEGLEKTGLTGEAPSDGNVVSFEDGAAYEQGYRAGKSGKSIGDGPYTEDSDTGVQWAAGYNKAQKDLAEEMALATKPARGRRREHETDPLPAV